MAKPREKKKHYCSVCGCELPPAPVRRGKYSTCRSRECIREANRRRTERHRQALARGTAKIRADRVEKLNEMRRAMPDKEAFAKNLAVQNSMEKLARMFHIHEADIRNYKNELFGKDFRAEEVKKMGIRFLKEELERETRKKETGRNIIPTRVYKITDMEAFEAGGPGTYQGLEYVRTDYIDEMDRVYDFIQKNIKKEEINEGSASCY